MKITSKVIVLSAALLAGCGGGGGSADGGRDNQRHSSSSGAGVLEAFISSTVLAISSLSSPTRDACLTSRQDRKTPHFVYCLEAILSLTALFEGKSQTFWYRMERVRRRLSIRSPAISVTSNLTPLGEKWSSQRNCTQRCVCVP
jgi:hypothetical protein